MRQSLIKVCAVALAIGIPAAAKADIVIFAPTSLAWAIGNGPYGSTSYGVGIRNGVQDPYYGSVGATAGNALENSASGSTGGASSNAIANLGDGTLHASAAAGPAAGGFAFAELADTLYFNNTTDAAIGLSVRFSLDGTINTAAGNPFAGGYGSLTLTGCGACGDLQLGAFGTPAGPAANVEYLVFDRNGIYAAEGTTISGPPAGGTYAYGSTFDAGYMTGYYQTTLYVPTGQSTLGVRTQLSLDCRDAVCDFANTGALTFGPLASGLSYTSASGGFMSSLVTPPTSGAVPEPATWAMMILGMGGIGAMLRRRRPALAAA